MTKFVLLSIIFILIISLCRIQLVHTSIICVHCCFGEVREVLIHDAFTQSITNTQNPVTVMIV
jgi:hypothetical protein